MNGYDWIGRKLGLSAPGNFGAGDSLDIRWEWKRLGAARLADVWFRRPGLRTERAGITALTLLHREGFWEYRERRHSETGRWRWWAIYHESELHELRVYLGDYVFCVTWSTGRAA